MIMSMFITMDDIITFKTIAPSCENALFESNSHMNPNSNMSITRTNALRSIMLVLHDAVYDCIYQVF